jgi:hypothetical protein
MTVRTFFKTVWPQLGEHASSLKTLKQTGERVVDSAPIKPPEDWTVYFNSDSLPIDPAGLTPSLEDTFVPTGSSQQSSLQEKVALPDIPHEQLELPSHYLDNEYDHVADHFVPSEDGSPPSRPFLI